MSDGCVVVETKRLARTFKSVMSIGDKVIVICKDDYRDGMTGDIVSKEGGAFAILTNMGSYILMNKKFVKLLKPHVAKKFL